MLLPKGGLNWKAAQSKLPPSRAILNLVARKRVIVLAAIITALVLLWRGVSNSASEMQSFYCWGPSKSPMDMTANDYARWNAHLQTPVLYNPHAPIEVNSTSIQHVNLNPITSTTKAITNEERVLILTPLKDASKFLPKYFDLLAKLTYPHHLIDLAFLISDSEDDTHAALAAELDRIQSRPDKVPFRSAVVVEKDFGYKLSQDIEERHAFAAQAPRRKAMARARNYLLYSALKPEHSWVYWRDSDIEESPDTLIEDFIAHDKDVVVPNIWFHRYEQNGHDIEGRFDYNSWVESNQALALAKKLDKDTVIVEGYKQFRTGRTYMCLMGDRNQNRDEELELDGIGGVSILVKADVHRSGVNFPAYAFENQAETEGFAKMAKRAGYTVVGLPNYVVWHKDTDEKFAKDK
ncbi:uncharacterized protein LMH87_007804 [Akanthomyces muscarius]|uniref:Mannan polymerase II complex ANP1 subunit n=1 Tax=Akanthomyces muscarius TaxID=2231603 RepID=A0A9W8QLF8_AKAMU|nr:uncharacterized protein LMH87_007804 [Akanthomyces muscarius]KAJ4159866.1 hypothetical protein LMH87_007804 [Akanthomyces muscarius]